jgi:hypothetical protein
MIETAKYISPEIEVDSMTNLQKFEIWFHYYVRMLTQKHDFFILDNLPSSRPTSREGQELLNKGLFEPVQLHGWNIPDKVFKKLGCSIYYFGRDLHIKSFEEFTAKESNIKTLDVGVEWKERGYASRYIVTYFGIYDWWGKFRDELELINPLKLNIDDTHRN